MALLAAYMEEVRLWLGKLADKTVEGSSRWEIRFSIPILLRLPPTG
jgi:hypothetical protein